MELPPIDAAHFLRETVAALSPWFPFQDGSEDFWEQKRRRITDILCKNLSLLTALQTGTLPLTGTPSADSLNNVAAACFWAISAQAELTPAFWKRRLSLEEAGEKGPSERAIVSALLENVPRTPTGLTEGDVYDQYSIIGAARLAQPRCIRVAALLEESTRHHIAKHGTLGEQAYAIIRGAVGMLDARGVTKERPTHAWNGPQQTLADAATDTIAAALTGALALAVMRDDTSMTRHYAVLCNRLNETIPIMVETARRDATGGMVLLTA